MNIDNKRFFMDQDNDCHWYIIEADKRKEWDAWLNLDSDDEASWNVPDFAQGIDHPRFVEFSI
jgi:hypothetical protein